MSGPAPVCNFSLLLWSAPHILEQCPEMLYSPWRLWITQFFPPLSPESDNRRGRMLPMPFCVCHAVRSLGSQLVSS